MAKTNAPTLLTPAGISIWPKLNEPDTKFNAAGEFHTKIAYDADDDSVKAFVAKLEKIRDDFYDATVQRLIDEKKAGKAKNLKKLDVAKAELDEETGDETGRILLNAKLKHKVVTKTGKSWEQKPDFFNAQKVALKNPPRIGSGSKLRLFVEANPYLRETDGVVGVSLRLKAVQIITLVTGGARSADQYGFDEEDGDVIGDAEPVAGGDDDAPFDADDNADHDDI
ncbi:hypothetical protein [Caulobacter segnis]|uniref:Single-stranded DNA-binding protein BPT7 domain-containing protein n=1 Tax=Caulobacter segnis TaxID=88688 RepID=A0A2W5VDW0_9CAUL|nr:hypothetical protein [Caulobacter segnis]PZR36063.1 MAG: hypothetical protein DI526_04655 [Caulobacter segnis]